MAGYPGNLDVKPIDVTWDDVRLARKHGIERKKMVLFAAIFLLAAAAGGVWYSRSSQEAVVTPAPPDSSTTTLPKSVAPPPRLRRPSDDLCALVDRWTGATVIQSGPRTAAYCAAGTRLPRR